MSTPPSRPQPPRPQPPSSPDLLSALSSIAPLSDLQKLPTIPCARYSLLFGIMAGASIGSLRFIFSRVGKKVPTTKDWSEVGVAANWAVGAWGVGSLGAWETCRRRQSAESARMHSLVSEIKNRRAARPAGGERIGGVLVGEKGREMLERNKEGYGEVQEKKEGEKRASWWRLGL